MANKGNKLQSLSKVYVLLSIMTLKTNAIETVNVVDFCGQNIRGNGMIVNSHQESKKYYFVTMGTDCHFTMQAASPKDKVQFHFRFFLVYSLLRLAPQSPAPLFPESPRGLRLEPSTPVVEPGDPCHAGSYIQFYDGRDKNSPPIGPPLCGKSPPRPVLSTGNHLTLRLATRGTQPRVDFVGDFTSFRLGFNQSACSGEPYFLCQNGKCIPMSLVCDDKGIDNCGDGSDLEDHLPSGCKGHLAGQLAPAQAPPPAVTPTPPVLNPPTFPMSTYRNCGTLDGVPNHDSVTDSPPYLSLLALFIALGVIAGVVLLCWCCWSPGWFLWRISVCRFLPCCNSACASCKLCARSCAQNKEHRPAKVSPQGQVPINCAALATLTTAPANATTITV
ncbi:low-density lipoprotein receptor class A domain-containing protein 2-like isoform X1 [Coregonus clupeaformis]|uniref:low-density lipoprotein receptor class A domain-containing protein 2-like isoform X1 n=2 Tax=Coregonus clupeaformis TaxID=59861 RepID=UPI001BDF9E32|nr:low-density lipoprotein receptor class A domain-containing protein 2-like isoform X1 [Coregonus clupeaformis]